MTTKQLRDWLFQNSQDDQWWISLDAVTEECPVTVNEIEERLRSGDYGHALVLHVSHGEMAHPTWIEVTLQQAIQPPASALAASTSLPQGYAMPTSVPISRPASSKTESPLKLGDSAGMRMLLPVGRSGWAIAAGYLGLFGLVVLPAPLALIVSIIAIFDIQNSKKIKKPKHGMGRAVFGLIVGLIGSAVLVVIMLN